MWMCKYLYSFAMSAVVPLMKMEFGWVLCFRKSITYSLVFKAWVNLVLNTPQTSHPDRTILAPDLWWYSPQQQSLCNTSAERRTACWNWSLSVNRKCKDCPNLPEEGYSKCALQMCTTFIWFELCSVRPLCAFIYPTMLCILLLLLLLLFTYYCYYLFIDKTPASTANTRSKCSTQNLGKINIFTRKFLFYYPTPKPKPQKQIQRRLHRPIWLLEWQMRVRPFKARSFEGPFSQ